VCFGEVAGLPLECVHLGDTLIVFPQEICPIDGTVIEGHGVMDKSYLVEDARFGGKE